LHALKRFDPSVFRAVAMFALSGVFALVVVGVTGGFVLRGLGRDQATREAERIAVVTGQDLLEPRLTDGILTGDSRSLLRLENVVFAVLNDPIVRVKIWDTDGRILYSDVPELIDSTYPLDADADATVRSRTVSVCPIDVSLPQNRFERGIGELLQVTIPLQTPDGSPVLFQAFLRSESVLTDAHALWRSFAPVLGIALVALALLQIPIAYRLARRVTSAQREHEQLLTRAIESGDLERRRLAADLHDGAIQEFAGLATTLDARAEMLKPHDPTTAGTFRDAAEQTRSGIRALRSTVVSAYPPSLGEAGLRSAITDLIAPVREGGIRCFIDIADPLELPPATEALLFRVAQESIRNVVTHSQAEEAYIQVLRKATTVDIEIRDDGIGLSEEERQRAESQGHLGLSLLRDLVRDARGTLHIESEPGVGTTIRVEVPVQ
jgi:signal transduction histidine kinase